MPMNGIRRSSNFGVIDFLIIDVLITELQNELWEKNKAKKKDRLYAYDYGEEKLCR